MISHLWTMLRPLRSNRSSPAESTERPSFAHKDNHIFETRKRQAICRQSRFCTCVEPSTWKGPPRMTASSSYSKLTTYRPTIPQDLHGYLVISDTLMIRIHHIWQNKIDNHVGSFTWPPETKPRHHHEACLTTEHHAATHSLGAVLCYTVQIKIKSFCGTI